MLVKYIATFTKMTTPSNDVTTVYEMWVSKTLTKSYLYEKVQARIKRALDDDPIEAFLPKGLKITEWALTGSAMISILTGKEWDKQDADIVCVVDMPQDDLNDIFEKLASRTEKKHLKNKRYRYEFYGGNGGSIAVKIERCPYVDGIPDWDQVSKAGDIMLTTDSVEGFVSRFDYHICMSYCGNKSCAISDPERTFSMETYGTTSLEIRMFKYQSRDVKLLDDDPHCCEGCKAKITEHVDKTAAELGVATDMLAKMGVKREEPATVKGLLSTFHDRVAKSPVVDAYDCVFCDPRRTLQGKALVVFENIA